MILPSQPNTTYLKINLGNIEQSIHKPELTSLIQAGWTTIAAVPVMDENNPTLILILAKQENNAALIKRIIHMFKFTIALLIVAICSVVFLAIGLT